MRVVKLPQCPGLIGCRPSLDNVVKQSNLSITCGRRRKRLQLCRKRVAFSCPKTHRLTQVSDPTTALHIWQIQCSWRQHDRICKGAVERVVCQIQIRRCCIGCDANSMGHGASAAAAQNDR